MIKLILRKLYLRKDRFVTKAELDGFCKEIGADYNLTIRYLLYYGYLVRILRGIFYVKSIEERKLGRTDISYLEAIKEALRIKGVKRWYFGLETALKLNNLTHEYFTVDTVISDSIFRAKPISIMGHKFAFIRLKPALLEFGIKKGKLPVSDTEKTLLDFIYLKRRGRVRIMPSELIDLCSKKKLSSYSGYYGNSVKKEAEALYGKKGIR